MLKFKLYLVSSSVEVVACTCALCSRKQERALTQPAQPTTYACPLMKTHLCSRLRGIGGQSTRVHGWVCTQRTTPNLCVCFTGQTSRKLNAFMARWGLMPDLWQAGKIVIQPLLLQTAIFTSCNWCSDLLCAATCPQTTRTTHQQARS